MLPPPPDGHAPGFGDFDSLAPRWGSGDAALAFAIGLAGAVVVAIAYPLLTGTANAEALKSDLWFTIATVVAQQVAIIAACLWLVQTKGSNPRTALGIRILPIDLVCIPIGIVCSIAAGLVVAPIQNIGKHHTQEIVNRLNEAHGVVLIAFAFVVMVAAPVSEELLFRGVLLRSLQRRTTSMNAIMISGGIFAVTHALDPEAIVALPALFAFGMLLAVVALRTGRLGTTMCLHLGFNALAVIGAFAK
ncbi:MAG: CPBP family intramembrane glutamic endopeptidase [Acidimicrobiia bacterium]